MSASRLRVIWRGKVLKDDSKLSDYSEGGAWRGVAWRGVAWLARRARGR